MIMLLCGKKKNHASKMLPYQHCLSQNALLNNDADGAFIHM